jgi:hypothetical protein
MICPFAVQKPVSAHGGPIAAVLGVVEHVTAGEGDPYNEFANPANQVSSHFGIGNGQGGMADGLIEQYVDTAFDSWAQSAGNSTYLSVETEGVPGDPLTPAQVASFGRIMAWAAQNYGVPLVVTDTPGQRGLIGHGDGGQAWGGHLGCPGPARLAQRPAILNAAGAVPVPPPVTNSEVPHMMDRTPDGGGYWQLKPDGSVWSFGNAIYHGGCNAGAPERTNVPGAPDVPGPPGGLIPAGRVAVGITAFPTRGLDGEMGYWIEDDLHHVFAFGLAGYFGAAPLP